MIAIALTLFLSLSSPLLPQLLAETGYVSDMLILSVREGPGREYSVLSTLRSNARVEVLEKQGNYFKVRTENGDLGWVERRYISPELPKTIVIERLNKKIETLEQENGQLKEEKNTLEVQNRTLTEQNNALTSQTGDLSLKNSELERRQEEMIQASSEDGSNKALATAIENSKRLETDLQNTIESKTKAEETLKKVRAQYDELKKNSNNVAQLLEENERLKQKNEALSKGVKGSFTELFLAGGDDVLKTAMIKWFLSGAGVLIVGWLIGRSFSGGGSKRKRGML